MTQPVYIIAEAGVNHNGSVELAKKLVDIAKDAGADAVKFQTFEADSLADKNAPKVRYQRERDSGSQSQYDMLKRLELGRANHFLLKSYCDENEIDFLSTPFSEPLVDFLVDEIGTRHIKVPSGEVTNAPLLLKMAKKRKPTILSTGMADLNEIEQALSVIAYGFLNDDLPSGLVECQKVMQSNAGRDSLQKNVTILHCVTQYPVPMEQANLNSIGAIHERFGLPVGYSDHTLGTSAAIASVALGAQIIEKHFTISRDMEGPDHAASLEPDELKSMVSAIREVSAALGTHTKGPQPCELENIDLARRSLVASKPIEKGDTFSLENLTSKRPGTGVSPMSIFNYINERASMNFEANEQIK